MNFKSLTMHNFWDTETENCFHLLHCVIKEIKLNSLFEIKTQKMISKHFNLLFLMFKVNIIFFQINLFKELLNQIFVFKIEVK